MSRLTTALRTALADAAHGQNRLFELQTGVPATRSAVARRQLAQLRAIPMLDAEPDGRVVRAGSDARARTAA